MSEKVRILYVTTALHAPVHGGCMIRTTNICRQLKKYADLTMLGVSSNFVPEAVRFCEREFQPFYKVDIRHYSSYPHYIGRFLVKWNMHNPFGRGFRASDDKQKLFQELVSRHDIVWFHTLGAAHPFKSWKFPKSVMDLDDLRNHFYDQYANTVDNFRFKCSAKVQAFKWRKHQNEALEKFDRVIVCSEDDKDDLTRDDKVRVIPNGYVAPPTEPQWIPPAPNRIGFIGLLHYDPNRDGLIWFRDKVWPLIRKHNPDVTLRVIGQLPTPGNHVQAEGFEYLGYLPDTAEEMKTWSSLVVPITYGGGTRIKILDAFSKKIPVVATSIGAHGINAQNGKQMLLSDDPEGFAAHCIELLKNHEKARALACEAWTLFSETYSWDVIGDSLKKIIDECMR